VASTSPSRRTTVPTIDHGYAAALYRTHRDALAGARAAQRGLLNESGGAKAQLDDIEAELTYLFVRDRAPGTVVELGALHGWSTTWILRALRDADADGRHGALHSFDLIDRAALRELPGAIDYLFVDAAHAARFARWYIDRVFPLLPSGTPVSVHDVFHGRRPKPFSEGSVITSWLAEKGVPYFTASAAKAPDEHARLVGLKRDLGLDAPIRRPRRNPMIFFRMP
jgi:predicted O-methyltransferase YrrM